MEGKTGTDRDNRSEYRNNRSEYEGSSAEDGSLLRPGERIDDLQRGGLRIIQDPSLFCFGMDAVLLSAYVRIKKARRGLDRPYRTGRYQRSRPHFCTCFF